MMSLKELQSIINAPQLGAGDIMKCALGVKKAEIAAYCMLVNQGPSTILEAADKLGKSRVTSQRLLQSLVEKGLATREELLIGLGGYKYVYRPLKPEKLKEAIIQRLETWFTRMLEEIEDFPEKIIMFECPSNQTQD
jgi:predicted transcriptional regulator